jgi:hypothetical protein
MPHKYKIFLFKWKVQSLHKQRYNQALYQFPCICVQLHIVATTALPVFLPDGYTHKLIKTFSGGYYIIQQNLHLMFSHLTFSFIDMQLTV